MARTDATPPEENFYDDIDDARVTSGMSCLTLVVLLVVLYALGAAVIFGWL